MFISDYILVSYVRVAKMYIHRKMCNFNVCREVGVPLNQFNQFNKLWTFNSRMSHSRKASLASEDIHARLCVSAGNANRKVRTLPSSSIKSGGGGQTKNK